MRKRITAFLMSAAMCFSFIFSCAAPVQAVSVTDDNIIDAALVVFRCKEGTYDSVNRNDNGALSIGKLQWHASRALELVKNIVSVDAAAARTLLGNSLYQEVISASQGAWNSRVLNAAEGANMSALLATDVSRAVQDETGRRDISGYISRGRALGVQTPEALLYYCDLENQYGSGGAASLTRQVKSMLSKLTIDSLQEYHTTLLQATSNYHSRRIWTYEYCSSLDWTRIGTTTTFYSSINLDLQPPEIQSSAVRCLNNGSFAVDVAATDDRGMADCRVEVSSDVASDKEWAGYCLWDEDAKLWQLRVTTGYFSIDTNCFYITATVSDESGNGTSVNLKVTAEELLSAKMNPCSAAEGHSYMFLYETPRTCSKSSYRVEQCCECYELRQTLLESAPGHSFRMTAIPPTCTQDGYNQYVCENCGLVVKVSTIPATEHTWKEVGGKTVCSVCGAEQEANS